MVINHLLTGMSLQVGFEVSVCMRVHHEVQNSGGLVYIEGIILLVPLLIGIMESPVISKGQSFNRNITLPKTNS